MKVWDGAQDKEEERRLIRQWWNNAKLIGEEAYFLKSVVGSGTNVTDASYAIVGVLAKKYPQQLPGIYTRMLKDSRNIDADRVVRAIAISSIPKQQKVESLVAGTRHHNVDHRALARELLKKVAPSRFED